MGSQSQLQARRLLLIQYSSRLPLRSPSFQWPNDDLLLSIQSHILQDIGIDQQLLPFEANPLENGHGSSRNGSNTKRRRADRQYEKSFFKALISKLEEAVRSHQSGNPGEEDEEEVDGSIFEHYTSLLSNESSQGETNSCPVQAIAPQASHITYYYPFRSTGSEPESSNENRDHDLMNGFQSVTLREEGTTISRGTTGLKTWEASLRLAAHFLAGPQPVISPGSRVLELGSGVGFLGVVCSQIQSIRSQSKASFVVEERREQPNIWLSDVEGPVLSRLEETLELNDLGSSSNAHLVPLNWIEVQEATSQKADSEAKSDSIAILEKISPTVIIAADVVFSPELLSPLCSTLKTALEIGRRSLTSNERDREVTSQKKEPKALIASTIRNQETYGKFLELLSQYNLCFEIVELLSPTTSSSLPNLPLFPSSHDEALDGKVQLLSITLS